MSEFKRNNVILKSNQTALLIIDIQEKILPVMQNTEMVLENALKLIKGFKQLNLPIFYTEQYTKGLGKTAGVLLDELKNIAPIEKMTFSCFGAGNLFNMLKEKNISQVVVVGIEAHVCVMQTILDLIANGFQVNVCADAVSSRKVIDYESALDRLRGYDVEVTTSESVLFELLVECGTDDFKAISKIVK